MLRELICSPLKSDNRNQNNGREPMLSYETLDTIADSYTPLLALISLALIVACLCRAQWRLAGLKIWALGVIALIAYGFMFLDNRLNIWSTFKLDYSTHTAVSLGLIIFLCFNASRLLAVWVVSFIGYALLMLYQGYHTIADIVTTGIVVGFPIAWIMTYLYKHFRIANSVSESGGRRSEASVS